MSIEIEWILNDAPSKEDLLWDVAYTSRRSGHDRVFTVSYLAYTYEYVGDGKLHCKMVRFGKRKISALAARTKVVGAGEIGRVIFKTREAAMHDFRRRVSKDLEAMAKDLDEKSQFIDELGGYIRVGY